MVKIELMLSNCGAGADSWKSPLDSREIKPVDPKRNQLWIVTGRTDDEAPILRPPDVKANSLEKTLIEGRWKKGCQRMRRQVGWHQWLNGHESEQALGQWSMGEHGVLYSMGSQSGTWLSKWTTTDGKTNLTHSQAALVVKNPSANAGDMRHRFSSWVGKIPWRRASNPLQYSCLENPTDRGVWQVAVYWAAKSQAWLEATWQQ